MRGKKLLSGRTRASFEAMSAMWSICPGAIQASTWRRAQSTAPVFCGLYSRKVSFIKFKLLRDTANLCKGSRLIHFLSLLHRRVQIAQCAFLRTENSKLRLNFSLKP